jgi:CO/xanthine dehydrogenase Mo-binding subunit
VNFTFPAGAYVCEVEVDPKSGEVDIVSFKGCGEAGAIGSPPAVINAIANALGVERLDMPATPWRVWEALRSRELPTAAA